MGLRRSLNADGIRHANADSATHARHVRERREKRMVEWIPEAASETNPSEIFKLRADDLGLGKGLYFVGVGCEELEATGPEFEKHLSSVNWNRRWNYAQMKRGEKVSTVRRKRSQPAVNENVTNLSPWQMTFINRQLEVWENAGVVPEERKELLFAWLEPLRQVVVEEFQKDTGWDVLGSYIHLDSNKIHFGVIYSRVGVDNTLVGKKYCPSVGPWSVAQVRVHALGAGDPADTRLRQNLEKFRARHGQDTIPLDVRLHSVVDAKFEEQVSELTDGETRFAEAKQHYREWKTKARRDSVVRSPGAERIGWEVLRLVSPLFPPPVQATIRLARTAYQAFQVVSTALDSISTITQPQPTKTHEITKTL
ncbi:MAG: hypothetical protein WCO60_10900 [Verrucomicrobiota bacterium]